MGSPPSIARQTIGSLLELIGKPNREFQSICQGEWEGRSYVQILSAINGILDTMQVGVTPLMGMGWRESLNPSSIMTP